MIMFKTKQFGRIVSFIILIHAHLCLCQTNDGDHLSKLYKNNLREIINIMDEDIDPCDNYFQHACGYYKQHTLHGSLTYAENQESEESFHSAVPPMLFNHEDRMHFFEEQYPNFASVAGELLRDLYGECKALRNFEGSRREQQQQRDQIEAAHWSRIVAQIPFLAHNADIYKSWPFLRYQWEDYNDETELSWANLAAYFAAHGITTFLNMFFAEQTIYTAPPDNFHCGDIRSMRATLRPLLQGRNAQIADIIGNELLIFCRELTGELPLEESVEEAAQHNSTDDIMLDEMNVEYFDTFFSLLNFTEVEVRDARKLAMDVPKMRLILSLFRRTEPRIIYNFVMWRGYETLSQITSDCYILTEEFEELVLAEYWQWHVFEPYFNRRVAMATYLFHTTRFQELRKKVLMGEHWDAFLDKRPERKDFNLPRLLKSYANEWLEPGRLVRPYKSLVWRRGAFYRNLLEMRRLRIRSTFTQPQLQEADDVNSAHHFLRQFLYFTILVLKEPLFHYYSTQGLELWQDSRLLHSTDGFYTALDCLEHQNSIYVDESDETSIYHILSEGEILEIFRFYRAFIASYRDYQFWLSGEFFAFTEDFVLETFDFDSRRIMFYAVAQQYCGRNDALYSNLINRSSMNMPEFQGAFNCTLEAPMNPIVKCIASSCDNFK